MDNKRKERKPNVSYLTVAYEVPKGDSIAKVAQDMVGVADQTGQQVHAVFNDLDIWAWPGCSAQSIVEYWDYQLHRLQWQRSQGTAKVKMWVYGQARTGRTWPSESLSASGSVSG